MKEPGQTNQGDNVIMNEQMLYEFHINKFDDIFSIISMNIIQWYQFWTYKEENKSNEFENIYLILIVTCISIMLNNWLTFTPSNPGCLLQSFFSLSCFEFCTGN